MKKAVGISIAVLMVLSISILVYAHCHNTLPCEKVVQHVCQGGFKWLLPANHVVRYMVNPSYPNHPSMLTDAKAAGDAWKRVWFRIGYIAFKPTYDGTTTRKPGGSTSVPTSDGYNVVGWRDLGDTAAAPNGVCYRWMFSNGWRIKEADIALNYYKLWRAHGTPLTGSYFCMRNTLTHEFGHFAGLRDVYDTQCSEYVHYTMNGEPAHNHDKESLACEDKYALEHKYGYIP